MMNELYTSRTDCRLCASMRLERALSLAPMPIATPNIKARGVDRSDPLYQEEVPLELFLCTDCGLLQLIRIGNPRVSYDDYVYTTSSSLGLPQHFEKYAADVLTKLKLEAGSLVVEIGSNDGTLLRHMMHSGMRVLGIDPAGWIARRASEQGVPTLSAFFTQKVATDIRSDHGPATLLIANNVIANIDDLSDLAEGVRTLLADDGVFVFETQYAADVVEKNLLDTVYHEHLSYFNVKPLQLHFARHGLEVFDVENIPSKGGSIRVFVQPVGGRQAQSTAVAALINREQARGHYGTGIYQEWGQKITDIRCAMTDIVSQQRRAGRSVGGYGVSVGTTALMPQFGVSREIDMLFDDDPHKDAHLDGPGYSIPVLSAAGVYEKNPGIIIVFAWRYAEPIIAKHRRYLNEGGRFIIPLPSVSAW